MTVAEILSTSNCSKLDAEILMAHVLKNDRSWILAHPDYQLTREEENAFLVQQERRKNHEPIAYILGVKEFYGREFVVNSSVLIPRPSTESLIDVATQFWIRPYDSISEVDTNVCIWSKVLGDCSDIEYMVDIGTGSGCIGITLSLEIPQSKVVCTDIQKDALEVCVNNSIKHAMQEKVEVRLGSLLEPLETFQKPYILVSNPPYIPPAESLMPDVKDYEPSIALFGTETDGGDIVRKLVKQAEQSLYCKGFIIECRAEHVSL